MNNITFDGRLVTDPDLRYTQSGEAILSFRVASDIGFGDRKTTNWFSCQVWGKRGETLKNYLSKGKQVTVYGQLTLREWHDKEGGKRISPDIRVNELSMHGSKEGGAAEGDYHSPAGSHQPPAAPQRRERSAEQASSNYVNDIDEIPF
ncbi:single-stranded DNA-binding protein [Gulbenkiania mobilis]|uniref:single-stranded DNA-binding protein n=1 Tax=Gulbenkiania mobilis TaxID=397457 RepID=UPI0006BBBF38|nr:single-stranded DNA-binding protein [Gulbenkiania mobilis]